MGTAAQGATEVFTGLPWNHMFDIAIMWFLLYQVYMRFRGTQAMRLLVRVFAVWLGYLAAQAAGLTLTAFLLWALWIAFLILFLITFQGEIHRIFMQANPLLRMGAFLRRAMRVRMPEEGVQALAEAALALARGGIGAIIAVERRDPIDPLLRSPGEAIGAEVRPALLETIFFPGTPCHDGAAVIRRGRIHRVGAVLPLSESPDLPAGFGTRHRAAIGLTEKCDAVAIVVSEERGEVSAAEGGRVERIAGGAELVAWLTARLHAGREEAGGRKRVSLEALRENWRPKAAVLAAVLILWMAGLGQRRSPNNFFRRLGGGAEAAFSVPLAYYNIPAGLALAEGSAGRARVRLRGPRDLLNFLDPERLRLGVNLKGAAAGEVERPLGAREMELPAGVEVLAISPAAVRVRLEGRPAPGPGG